MYPIAACFLALLAGLFAVSPPAAMAQPRFNFATAPGNLPKSVVPSHYRLTLNLDPASEVFSGSADIAIEVHEPVAAVLLHAHELQAVHIELRQGSVHRELQASAGPIPQSWSLAPVAAPGIAPGRYRLHIEYTGKVNRSGVGLYRAGYAAGQPGADPADFMLATQLESVDARRLFPGFDEPAFRAVFELAVRAPRGLDVLSNMPQAGTRTQGQAVLHRYRPTPPMPTYLVAVSVGRYDVLSGRAGGVPLRLLTAPGKRAQAAYAMQVTRQVVPYFNTYFGVPYALPKLDQLAVPSVRQGAMEDWGLISYTETALLFDPAKSSPHTQRRVFSVIAHEIAHQWFGNLVTAASWDEIWLNEAFATWMATKATEHFNPAWQVALEQRFPLDGTMAGDAGGATRAIRSGPVSEASVFDVFDSITYDKGGAVLGMIEQWMGPAAFRRGLAAYMRERRFSNATAGDLWHHMAQASKRDVAAVAASWTDQRGFPLLQVDSECSGPPGRQVTRVSLSQRRFRDGVGDVRTATTATTAAAPTAAASSTATEAQLWRIPLRLARGNVQSTVMLDRERDSFELPGCAAEPLLANAGGVGYYRVKYDARGAEALAASFTRLAPADQVNLLSDSFALAQAGELPMARWLALVTQLPQVSSPARGTLFSLASGGFEFLRDAMAGTPAEPLVQAAARRVLEPELARLGWAERPQDDAQTRKLRGMLIEHLARFDDAATVRQALERFDADEAGREPLAASVRWSVLQAAGMHADRARFDQMLARLKAARGEEDRWLYASALAGGRDPQRAAELLAASLAGVTTPNIAIALPRLVSHQSPFAEQSYAFTLEHWDALAQLAGGAMYGRHWLLPGAANFNDAARGAQLVQDQERKAGADGAVPAARIASRIALLSAVRERDAQALQTLLATP